MKAYTVFLPCKEPDHGAFGGQDVLINIANVTHIRRGYLDRAVFYFDAGEFVEVETPYDEVQSMLALTIREPSRA